MKNRYSLTVHIAVLIIFAAACTACSAQKTAVNKNSKTYQILYFNPEVFPEIEEIKEPTYTAFFSALSDKLSSTRSDRLLHVDYNIPYDKADPAVLVEFCDNNSAHFAVVPKVKYFKVGIGKYVFSNQVVVSMKVYNSGGELLAETSYDTYRKNGRLLGSAENSIKIGTNGALKRLNKILKEKYRLTAGAAFERYNVSPDKAGYN